MTVFKKTAIQKVKPNLKKSSLQLCSLLWDLSSYPTEGRQGKASKDIHSSALVTASYDEDFYMHIPLPCFELAIFYGVACLEDTLKRMKGKKDIKFVTAFRDLLFTTLAFPVSTFVFLSFWILFLYDRELVYPKLLDGIFPVWMNHAMHTSIFPFSLVEIILRPHCYPMKKKGLTLLAAASLVYISRLLWIYLRTGTWVYPVFAKLSAVGLAVFFSLSYIFSASIYLLGEKLNHWKWGDLGQSRKKKK